MKLLHALWLGLFISQLSIGCSQASEPAADDSPTSPSVTSSPLETLDVSESVPIFCRDDTGTFQPLVRTNYGRLKESFLRQFSWIGSLSESTSTIGYLVFSQDGTSEAPETITYVVQPYDGGIALLHMRVRLEGLSEDLSGTSACSMTFGIINVL